MTGLPQSRHSWEGGAQMFFKQIRRTAEKNRKGNSLYFASLVIAIVAFYTLLSLGSQDVMRFLKTVESDAVGKLLMLLPVVYGVSLFFVFFMVFFACRYHLSRRRKEFGLYLMMGMRRGRLLFMLFGETLLNHAGGRHLLSNEEYALAFIEGIGNHIGDCLRLAGSRWPM